MLVDYGTFPLKKWGRKGNDNMIVLTLKKKKRIRDCLMLIICARFYDILGYFNKLYFMFSLPVMLGKSG